MGILEKIISAGLKAPTNDHMRDWQFVVVTDKDVAVRLLECIPKGISDADMEQLIRDWNLNDKLQQECYRNAVPKQYRMKPITITPPIYEIQKNKSIIFKLLI